MKINDCVICADIKFENIKRLRTYIIIFYKHSDIFKYLGAFYATAY